MNLTNKELSTLMPGYALPVKPRAKSQRKEEGLVTLYTTWFKSTYEGVPYQINSKEQKRSYAAQNVLKKQEFKPGVPDFQLDRIILPLYGFRLEFKKDYDTLFTKKGLLRNGPENHFYEQDDYHDLLEKENIFCTFVWELEQAKQLTRDYFNGVKLVRPIYPRSIPNIIY